MKVAEQTKVLEGDLDWIPLIGRWLSRKLGLVDVMKVYVINLGENGELRMVVRDEFESEEEKKEVIGRAAQNIMMNQKPTGVLEDQGHKIYFNYEFKQWT